MKKCTEKMISRCNGKVVEFDHLKEIVRFSFLCRIVIVPRFADRGYTVHFCELLSVASSLGEAIFLPGFFVSL